METIFNFISTFLKTPGGQNLIRIVFTTLGIGGMYLLVMSIAELVIKLERSSREKIKTKLKAKLSSIILGFGISFLISFMFYNVNNNKLLMGQSLIYYFVGVAVFLIFTSERLKDFIRAVRGKSGKK